MAKLKEKRMKKKVLALVLCLALVTALVIGLVACNNNRDDDVVIVKLPSYDIEAPDYSNLQIPANFKIGMICLHDENSTYDKNFINAMKEVQEEFNLSNEQVIIVTGIPEDETCYTQAKKLANDGCNIVFADSFGHEDYMLKAAKEFPNTLFAHATGTQAADAKLPNFVNAFASIYEGRYLAGVTAGLKLNEMIESGKITADQAKMGYVGAFTYAEVISGYTSFYLGAKSVCPSVTMDVTFTGSWYHETREKNAAISLINKGCVLISQHADSMGAPNACEEKGVPNVSYNGSTVNACPETFIISSRINWAPYYKYIIAQTVNGEKVDTNWTGTLKNGSVELTDLGGKAMAAGTVEKLVEVRNNLLNGTLHVFDINNFTVDGKQKTSYAVAGVSENVIADGYFHESEFRSAPYFDLLIDGINLLNRVFSPNDVTDDDFNN